MNPGPGGGAFVMLVGAGLLLLSFSFFGLDAKRDDFGCSFLLRELLELLEPFLLVVLTLVTLIVSFRSEDREPRGVRATSGRVP